MRSGCLVLIDNATYARWVRCQLRTRETLGPGERGLELGCQRKQQSLAQGSADKLYAQGQAICPLIERQRDGRLAGDVPDSGKGNEFSTFAKFVEPVLRISIHRADRERALAQRGQEQHIVGGEGANNRARLGLP